MPDTVVLVLPGQTTAPAVVANVPEAANYQLVYSLSLPATGNLVSGAGFTNYAVNNSLDVRQYSRVAYYMELQKTGDAAPRYVWASMDAFTPLAGRIGVPTPASGAVFQQNVANLNVVSNVAGVVTGTGIATGNIEFWPTNYTQANALAVPGASATTFDFGDTRNTTGTHGSMQVHNHGAAQTLFALSNWGTAANTANVLSMGIGNNPTAGQNPDYTLSNNGTSWDLRRVLQVYVLPAAGDNIGPVATRAVGSSTLGRLVVTFDEPLAESSAVPANFTIAGLTVTGATLLPGGREIAFTTSAQTPATAYTVAISNVRDRAAGNPVLPGASVNFTSYSPPAILAGIADAAGYDMIYRLAIPTASPQWNLNTIPYGVDESKYGERTFDRVAYLMELNTNWVWVSFDRHTNALSKIGIPTLNVTATAFQQLVTNMNVASNVGTITTGNGITTGNIEFWGGNYSGANGLGIPGANAVTFDFGDTMTAGAYGSMQIHNHGAAQVLMAYNNWGSSAGLTSDTGIGNHPTPSATASGAQLDWTFSSSASASTVKNLYVFTRPGGTPSGAAPVFYAHPCDRCVSAGSPTTFMAQATGAVSWQWRKDGTPLPGQTQPWLEIPSVSAADLGSYDVVATGSTLVTATSLPAVLTLNQAPTFSGYLFAAEKDQPTTVLFAKITARAADANGDVLNVTGVSAASTAGGTVAITAGGVLYSPPAGFTGADSFTVTISDGRGGSVTGTVNVIVSDGSNPSANQASIVLNGDGTVDVLFYGIPGRDYQLQRSTNLVNWTTLATLTAAVDGKLPLHDPAPPPGSAFYRTREP